MVLTNRHVEGAVLANPGDVAVCYRFDELVAKLTLIFERHGCSRQVANILAVNCASAERDGVESHGVFRVAGYVSTLRSGWVDGGAVPIVADVAPGMVRVDAQNGFAQPALAAARDLLVAKARRNGIAIIAIRNSHHFSALSLDVEPFADQGLVALSVVNSMAVVVPHGGRNPVYGTNPVAFAAPRSGGKPVVFDQASSAMAHGDVMVAAREGRDLPAGVGVDKDGRPTISPAAVLAGGALLPFGGHKGSSIAMMVEILCAALVGGKFSSEVDWSSHRGAQTPHTGQTIIVIDPATGSNGIAPFTTRVQQLIDTLHEAGVSHIPGDRRHFARQAADADGIWISSEMHSSLEQLATLVGSQ